MSQAGHSAGSYVCFFGDPSVTEQPRGWSVEKSTLCHPSPASAAQRISDAPRHLLRQGSAGVFWFAGVVPGVPAILRSDLVARVSPKHFSFLSSRTILLCTWSCGRNAQSELALMRCRQKLEMVWSACKARRSKKSNTGKSTGNFPEP